MTLKEAQKSFEELKDKYRKRSNDLIFSVNNINNEEELDESDYETSKLFYGAELIDIECVEKDTYFVSIYLPNYADTKYNRSNDLWGLISEEMYDLFGTYDYHIATAEERYLKEIAVILRGV